MNLKCHTTSVNRTQHILITMNLVTIGPKHILITMNLKCHTTSVNRTQAYINYNESQVSHKVNDSHILITISSVTQPQSIGLKHILITMNLKCHTTAVNRTQAYINYNESQVSHNRSQ